MVRGATAKQGTELRVVERLRPLPVAVEIVTDPPGADLVVDGRPAGKAPAVVELRPYSTTLVVATAEGRIPTARRVGAAARASLAGETWDAVAGRTMAVYRRVIEERRAP